MDDDQKSILDMFPEVEGCSICKSPFHDSKECPQTKEGEPKFRFKTRKELGLKKEELPFKFRVDIDPEVDNEVEISRKRALLRLNSSKVYNLMGLSIKAQESQKTALRWLVQLSEEMDIEDDQLQQERNLLLPLIATLQDAFKKLSLVRQAKVRQAEAMEEVSTRARRTSRKARTRKKKEDKDFWVLRLNSGVDVPLIYGEDKTPSELLQEVADAIKSKEEK